LKQIIRTFSAIALGFMLCTHVQAATGNWDHAANIKDAAGRLAKLHKREGSQGVLKFLDACYRTHLLASEFSQGLEACMAQDYMHTQVLATIYAKLPLEQRKKAGVPSPEAMAQGMGQRFVSAFTQYKVAVSEAEEFKKLVDKHGFPVFVKGVFPKGTAKDAGSEKSGGAKPDNTKPGNTKPDGEK
jgi:hypothetical protein